ncbi:phosphodiesterase/alkaline phosphatase D [Sphaerisporangium krabiense]|uniref:Alkaline phosphatase D n=1 Tax=Sphaerisporangium krabiense TaxID=763782 RepID=A0A7W8Z132_9ACTN|nr:alkaline phosphatase D family protein [Sphaerisporangium krabiense]MBB5625213.1 alkaline phosphatase D [Sphaerisporangium krabiense]GII64278.1 phosphodiesterase/alkaline phosphatase D [Sphaerisporangium krabiense]
MTQTIMRRDFLKAAAAGTGVAVAGLTTGAVADASADASFFRHGVASGDPLPTAVIIWTRITPVPEATPGSGAGPAAEVAWQVATDPGFGRVVASGTLATGPDRDHTVKVDVQGLAPATTYHYRFLSGGQVSPTGRTRTSPGPRDTVAGLRLGVVSCSNWEAGRFAAYRHLAAREDLFGVVHLGDYIYEYGTGEYAARGVVVRPHAPAHEILTLTDYRIRHGQYKTDPDLQALHASVPWMVVWDDHEVANDAWSGGAENHTPATEGPWPARLAASRQAYFEWMPVRTGPSGEIHRNLRFGTLADLTMLDLRSYRSQQTSGTAVDDPSRTITGDAQMAWLKNTLTTGDARWRLIGNSVMISPLALGALPASVLGPLRELLGVPEGGYGLNSDQWDGYTNDRKELLAVLPAGTVFLTGDIHTTWANDVPLNAATYPSTPPVAVEFVVPSVTSDNVDDILKVPARTVSLTAEALIKATNGHVRAVELDSHGYGVLDVRPERVQMDWYKVSGRTQADARATWFSSYASAYGSRRLTKASGPVA